MIRIYRLADRRGCRQTGAMPLLDARRLCQHRVCLTLNTRPSVTKRKNEKVKFINTTTCKIHAKIHHFSFTSVSDPGCLSRIPDTTFFYPGSRIRIFSIPDPGSASKNLSIFNPKMVSKL